MEPDSDAPVSRNAPCPCGSGKKYKLCCGRLATKINPPPQEASPNRKSGSLGWGMLFGVLGVTALTLMAMNLFDTSAPSYAPTDTVGTTGTTEATPPPWYYDSLTNRHWDPGHAHWHDGPPPVTAGGQTGQTFAEPAPYQHDTVNNRHWDPDHRHWHDGPPPESTASEKAP